MSNQTFFCTYSCPSQLWYSYGKFYFGLYWINAYLSYLWTFCSVDVHCTFLIGAKTSSPPNSESETHWLHISIHRGKEHYCLVFLDQLLIYSQLFKQLFSLNRIKSVHIFWAWIFRIWISWAAIVNHNWVVSTGNQLFLFS